MSDRRGDRRVALEGRTPSEQLVEHDTDGVKIGRRGHRLPHNLLGGEVLRCADELAGAGQVGREVAEAFGDPEVGQLHRPAGAEEDVARLDVAVDDPRGVGRAQRGQHGRGDGECLVDVERAVLGKPGGHRRAVDQLHHQVEIAVGLPGVEHCNGVGMGEARRRAGLADEPLPPDPIDPRRGSQLDRHWAVEAQVVGGDHPRHATRAEKRAETITACDHLLHRSPTYDCAVRTRAHRSIDDGILDS